MSNPLNSHTILTACEMAPAYRIHTLYECEMNDEKRHAPKLAKPGTTVMEYGFPPFSTMFPQSTQISYSPAI